MFWDGGIEMKIALIGSGGIGRKRALNLPVEMKIKIVCDTDVLKGKQMAVDFGCSFERNWKKVVVDPEIEAVFVATTHNWLAPIGIESIKMGKHVFLEKPGATSLVEIKKLFSVYKKNPVVVAFGYNHRFHPAIQLAKKIIDSREYGEVMFVRARYGHGARLGYENEWRFDKKLSGGGELMDQGPHLIDLTNYLVGPMNKVTGMLGKMFWRTKLEDSAFWVMKNIKGQMAHLSVTCVEWKNIFSFEIMLQKAKVQVDGLGRSYGKEHLTLYKMRPEMGPPEIEEHDFPEEDSSWKSENQLFFQRIEKKDYSPVPIEDSIYVHKIIKLLYKRR